jgi:hypothetical protein
VIQADNLIIVGATDDKGVRARYNSAGADVYFNGSGSEASLCDPSGSRIGVVDFSGTVVIDRNEDLKIAGIGHDESKLSMNAKATAEDIDLLASSDSKFSMQRRYDGFVLLLASQKTLDAKKAEQLKMFSEVLSQSNRSITGKQLKELMQEQPSRQSFGIIVSGIENKPIAEVLASNQEVQAIKQYISITRDSGKITKETGSWEFLYRVYSADQLTEISSAIKDPELAKYIREDLVPRLRRDGVYKDGFSVLADFSNKDKASYDRNMPSIKAYYEERSGVLVYRPNCTSRL